MAKFKVLETIQYNMGLMGIYPRNMIDSTVNVFKSIEYFTIISAMVMNTLVCGAFIYKNPSDFQAILETLIVIFASSQSTGVYLSFGKNFYKVKDLHLKLQEIVDKSTFYFLNFIKF